MKRKRRIGFIPTIIIGGLVVVAYKLFRTPELDRRIKKFTKREGIAS